ncbi:Phosphatidylinositol 3,4,5-trisphosphate 3-phosphatase and protein-tyrosine-phosphatase PTEN2A [Cocos nucifera]|uniref:Phosphatidylinositol 3,4,5-trisphosphate 3-phosphatase and protein-tyrosine-phosphatase PTEN2A n=1 Tax=Cocos nucifera TaxID=13894 RepID=A0A8K0I5Y3_COCNU|nr:Phosphatidylinositol 3,4,5-trisphosphate 3-phosphatase and protein-tyrosine-phosphatase PTEN2A [Cocos nucifera]
MESQQPQPSSSPPVMAPDHQNFASNGQDASARQTPSLFSASGISSWARSLKIPQPSAQEDSQPGNAGKSPFARFTSGFGLHLSPKSPQQDESAEGTSTTTQPGVLGSLTRGLVDSSKSAVKAVQVKARHIVSQNKRRYQEGGFDLDMTYITENIIAMGFPAGDMSSGFFGYVEGFYRNHMEEVIKFFETHHKVACFPFDDHNCPPLQLIISFCQSAYSWLKEDIENVVVVHCKAGMARTGLMISSLLLYLKFFPTAEESIEYYNQKRCMDGKGLVLPSQIRYVKYFERILTYFNGENQPGRRSIIMVLEDHFIDMTCSLFFPVSLYHFSIGRYGICTVSLYHFSIGMPEDFWFSAPKKGIMVFALPGEPGLTELAGDFKLHFHDRQGDFYCWLNTTMMENRKILSTSDLDGFDKPNFIMQRKLPSPGFQVEVVLVDYDGSHSPRPTSSNVNKESDGSSTASTATNENSTPHPKHSRDSGSQDKDDVFSDSESEETSSSKSKRDKVARNLGGSTSTAKGPELKASQEATTIAQVVEQLSLKGEGGATKTPDTNEERSDGNNKNETVSHPSELESNSVSEFKAIAADASVFSFGDDEDYESE